MEPSTSAAMKTSYWTRLPDGRVRCDLCPRECRLREGQRGLCFIRACEDGEIVLTSYGRSSGFCVDPIEKKPLHHFLPGTPVLSFGTAGCNLTCKYCQNSDISKSREVDTLADHATPEAIADAAERLSCRSVAFTYNDPVIFLEYARDVAAACKDRNLRAVAVTAGYINPRPRAEFFSFIDAVNVDLKAFDETFYRRIASGHLEPVLDTLRYLRHETDVWLEITNLVVPKHNDSEHMIQEMCDWIVRELGPDVPLHFSAFHPSYRMKDVPFTPRATLRHARDIAKSAGLHHVYLGNVHDRDGDTTFCASCGKKLIERNWYELTGWHLSDGACPDCNTPCPGVFEARPGNWGSRRVALKLGRAGMSLS